MEKKNLTSGDIVTKHAFILYDLDDLVLYYFNDYYELLKFVNIPSWNLACRYNKNQTDIINIVIDGALRRLYTFERPR